MRNLRVLIAGTSSSYLDISKRILSLHYTDCVVDFAHSGSQCVEKAISKSYDVVLFDHELDSSGGPDIINTLKANKTFQSILIPLIEEGEEDKARKYLKMGATDYIVKARGYLTALPLTLRGILEKSDFFRQQRISLGKPVLPELEEGQVILDRKGHILSANQSMAKITNYSTEELLELTFSDLLPKDSEDKFYEWLNLVDDNGNSEKTFQTEILGKTGRKKILDVVLSAIKDENKEIVSYRGKIHNRKELTNLSDRGVDQVEMVTRVSQAITGCYEESLNDLLEKFTQIACDVFGFQRSTIALLDKRKKAFIKQAMVAPRGLTRSQNGSVEVPQEIVEKIFSNKFRVKAVYHDQSYTHNLTARGFDRRTQKRRSNHQWHERDLILVNLAVRNGDSFGYISLDNPISKSHPNRDTFHNLELFARLVSMAIENYYQFSALEKKSRRLKQILVTSNIFKLYLSLNELLKEVVWSIKFSLEFNLVALGLISKRSGNLEIKAVACEDKLKRQQLSQLKFPLDAITSLLQPEYYCEKSYFVNKEEEVLKPFKKCYYGMDLIGQDSEAWSKHMVLVVPIKSKEEKIIGILLVDDPINKKPPTQEMIRTLEILANQVSVAIDNRILYVQAKRGHEQEMQKGHVETNEIRSSGVRRFLDQLFK